MAARQQQRSAPVMAVLGPTGTGKSTLINAMLGLTGDAAAATSADGSSHTSATTLYRGQLSTGAACTMVDTPGLSDSQGRDSQHIAEMVKQLKAVGSINAFLIVMSGEESRITGPHRAMIAIFSECFGEDFLRNAVLVKTNWFEDGAAQRARARALIRVGKSGTPEEFAQRELHQVFADDFNYTGTPIPVCFIDSTPDVIDMAQDETDAITAKHQAALAQLASFAQLPPFACRDIQAVQTLLDRTAQQLNVLRAHNKTMEAQSAKERDEHAKAIATINGTMKTEEADHKIEMASKAKRFDEAEREVKAAGGMAYNDETDLAAEAAEAAYFAAFENHEQARIAEIELTAVHAGQRTPQRVRDSIEDVPWHSPVFDSPDSSAISGDAAGAFAAAGSAAGGSRRGNDHPADKGKKEYRDGHPPSASSYELQAAHYISVKEQEELSIDPASLAHDKNYRMANEFTNLSVHKRIDNFLLDHNAKIEELLKPYEVHGETFQITLEEVRRRLQKKIEIAKTPGENGKCPATNPKVYKFLKENIARVNDRGSTRFIDGRELNGIKVDHDHIPVRSYQRRDGTWVKGHQRRAKKDAALQEAKAKTAEKQARMQKARVARDDARKQQQRYRQQYRQQQEVARQLQYADHRQSQRVSSQEQRFMGHHEALDHFHGSRLMGQTFESNGRANGRELFRGPRGGIFHMSGDQRVYHPEMSGPGYGSVGGPRCAGGSRDMRFASNRGFDKWD